MAAPRRLDRRQLIGWSAAGAMFAVARPWRTFVTIVDAPASERLATLLPFDGSTRRVGFAYLRAHPDEADQAKLTDALTRALRVDSRAGGSVLPGGRADLAERAASVIRAELRSRTIVLLDGWVVSPTEARLAALTTIARS